MPLLLVSGHVEFPFFPLDFIGRGMLPARNGNIRTGGLLASEVQCVGTACFSFKGAVITVTGHKDKLELQIRTCNTRGSPKQGQAMQCHHDLSEGPLQMRGPTVQGRRPQGCRVIWESSWDVSVTVTQYGWIPKMQVFSHIPLLSAWKHTLPG